MLEGGVDVEVDEFADLADGELAHGVGEDLLDEEFARDGAG